MRIAFHNVDFSSRRGPNAFCTRLARELAIMGHHLVDPGSECDVDFINIASPGTKKRGRRKVLRLDGIWTRADQAPQNASIIQEYATADTIVWQSSYDRNLIERSWGQRHGAIIHNGACTAVHADAAAIASIRTLARVVFCAVAAWHPQKRLESCIAAARAYAATTGLSTCIIIVGKTSHTISGPDVFYAGDVDEHACQTIMQASDALIHLAWRDHCPNACVEALALGTPIVCASSGGTPELVTIGCGTIIEDQHDRDFDTLVFDYDAPPPINVSTFSAFPNKRSFDVSPFSIRTAAEEYQRVMMEVLST